MLLHFQLIAFRFYQRKFFLNTLTIAITKIINKSIKSGFDDFEDKYKHMKKYHGWRKPKKKKNDLL